jgi:hypothetical protein
MFKKTLILILSLVCVTTFLHSQNAVKLINESETERIEKYLSSDELAGRQIYTAGIEMAAKFIANEFKQNGLATFKNSDSHLQSFSRISTKFISAAGNFDGNNIDTKNIIAITSEPNLDINEKSGYEVVKIAKEDNLFLTVRKYMTNNKNYVILVDEALGANFGRLVQFKSGLSEQQKSIFIVLTNQTPTQYKLQATHKIDKLSLSNVVGIIPGKSLPNEYVIFSGHYDHLGVNGKRAVNGDSIYNGANDDAAGTTAMIMLSKYFSALANNERTLVFAAFTAEESGGFGAQYFSKQFDPLQVKAMFNIEMIGTESKWGKIVRTSLGMKKLIWVQYFKRIYKEPIFNFIQTLIRIKIYFTDQIMQHWRA